jgi:hypothetical protein
MKRNGLQFVQLKLLMTNWLECTPFNTNNLLGIFNSTTNHGAIICGHNLLLEIGGCEGVHVKGPTS